MLHTFIFLLLIIIYLVFAFHYHLQTVLILLLFVHASNIYFKFKIEQKSYIFPVAANIIKTNKNAPYTFNKC